MPLTNSELYIKIRRRLRDEGIEAHSLEARLIVAHAGGKTKEALLRDFPLYTSPEVAEKAQELLARRLDGEPVAYLTGMWEFYGLPLKINRDVLIPRSDTEVLVDTVLNLSRGKSIGRILDLCTGSGCIGIALAHAITSSRVILLDASPEALSIARQNIRLNGLDSRIMCIETDVTAAPPIRLGEFEFIVSNPPYISSAEISSLDASVRNFEPHMALDGGEDGLFFYRAILQKWKVLLKPGGYLVFEVGEDQAEPVTKLMNQNGFLNVGTAPDTAGISRVVFGKL